MSQLTKSPIWQQLSEHYTQLRDQHMRQMFADDPQRFQRFSIRLNDILFDYSKNRITLETMALLLQLAEHCDVPGWIEKMFAGEPINHTENRAVLHTALRNRRQELDRVKHMADAIRRREWRGVRSISASAVPTWGHRW